MILLVSGATVTINTLLANAPVGHLCVPKAYKAQLATGRPIAADNGCFNRLDPDAYRAMLYGLAPHADRVLWVTVPDVVADARATRRRWRRWRPLLAGLGLRAAYVLQDGELSPPWDALDCLFVGGTTAFKESERAAALCREARARGKWVHVGRVNTVRRLRMFDGLADSIDGSKFSRFPSTYLPRWTEILRLRQHHLFDVA